MVYLPPPMPPRRPSRRPPRWTAPELAPYVDAYVDGDWTAGRRIRRLLAPVLARMAEAALGGQAGRHRIAQNAVTVGLADLETGVAPRDPVAVVARAVAHVVLATGRDLPDWLAPLPVWEQALVLLLDVELVDGDRLARAFALDPARLQAHRARIAQALGSAPPRDSTCPGWSEVRAALRHADDGAAAHRESCGRCGLVAEQSLARRRRLWPRDLPDGALGDLFEPRRR